MKKQIIFIISIITIIFSSYNNGYSQPYCNSTPTGFDEEEYHDNGKRFPSSDYLADITILRKLQYAHKKGDDAKIKIIDINSPDGCTGWHDCGLDGDDYTYFFIVPGDYRAWGPLKIRFSGTSKKPKIISYYNPKASNPYAVRLPVKEALNSEKHVILEVLNVYNASSYWIFNGLTFSDNRATGENGKKGGKYSRIVGNSDHNIVNRCLFEGVVNGPNLKISHSNYNTIQNSIVRNLIGSDWIGIWIGGERSIAIGNRVVNNEIYDCNDGIQLVHDERWAPYGDLSGTVIENNDIYLTRKSYSDKSGYACAENAIDIKIGGKTNKTSDVVLILKNRIWGFRVSDTSCGPSGSNGNGIIIHKQARNILIKDNVFFDLPGGIGISHNNDRNTNVAVINNVFHRIKKYNKASAGIAINSGTHSDMYYNTISDAFIPISAKNKSNCRIQCNTIIESLQKFQWTEGKEGWSALNAWYNCDVVQDKVYSHKPDLNIVENSSNKSGFGDFTFYIQRWTGPEKVTFRDLFVENGSQVALIASPNTHCGKGGEGRRWWTKLLKIKGLTMVGQ